MKFESDTEIDRLLRRHARRGAAASASPENSRAAINDNERAASSHPGGVHLDADEVNAYAEGALPDASRSRYFAHLADCDECRSLVTKLTLASGVAREPSAESVAVAPASASRSWREWLAALFSPPVLRYGVPALALLAVIVVAFVATRQRPGVDLVARNEQPQTSPVQESAESNQQFGEQAATTTTTNTNAAPAGENARSDNSGATIGNPRMDEFRAASPEPQQPQESDALRNSPEPLQKPQSTPLPTTADGVFGRARDNRDEAESESKRQPPPSPPVAAAPAAKPSGDDQSVARQEAAPKTGDADEKNKSIAALSRSSGKVVQDGVASGGRAAAARAATESNQREQPMRKSRPASPKASVSEAAGPVDKEDRKDERAEETRSAGGRRFKRQGGVWVDTAYNSSRATVNIARGSEQYRALVADEPNIRAIADQLGGTVIVVWKSRAYKIY